MGDFATYRAVHAEALAAALAEEEVGPALGQLAYGDQADSPQLDLTNTYDALVYVLVGPDFDRSLIAERFDASDMAGDGLAVLVVVG